MTKEKPGKTAIVEVLSLFDEIQDAAGAIAEIRERLKQFFQPDIDEEERLALYCLDMSIVQLNALAVSIAAGSFK